MALGVVWCGVVWRGTPTGAYFCLVRVNHRRLSLLEVVGQSGKATGSVLGVARMSARVQYPLFKSKESTSHVFLRCA